MELNDQAKQQVFSLVYEEEEDKPAKVEAEMVASSISTTPVSIATAPPRNHLIPVTTTRRSVLLSLPSLCATGAVALLVVRRSKEAGWALAESYDPLTKAEREASDATSRRISEAVQLLEAGRELQSKGDFTNALACFTLVVDNYKDFALSEYARVGRALALYEVGDRDQAITEMEDVSVSLRGYPEVHAALAAALYVDKHAPLLAENQFTIATLLDPHYTDISYVKETKHWPPSLVSSLQHFITLS